ncbi:MAG: Holliday junction resolvase Hjc [Candidatus Methanofastidiosia archaeon]
MKSSSYKKGRKAERFVVEKLWKRGYAAVKIPGSGRAYKRPHPDVVAGNGRNYFTIEVKVTQNDYKYFPKKEVEDLKSFSEIFGAKALFAVRFKGKWRLFETFDLGKTKKGYKALSEKGRMFEEVF